CALWRRSERAHEQRRGRRGIDPAYLPSLRHTMAQALLGLGGHVGDVRTTLDGAVAALGDGREGAPRGRPSGYRTPPWGMTQQPPFINLALVVETALSPRALLERALRVETMFGRDRAKELRWGPRRLDIDIIAYDELEIGERGLTLPHPRLF